MTRHEIIAKQVIDHIDTNLGQSLNMHSISDRFGVSAFTLQRIFKSRFHETVHQYILRKRLEKAYRLLKETDIPIKGIVSMAGFKSIPSFTRKFHQKYGITPAMLRTRMEDDPGSF